MNKQISKICGIVALLLFSVSFSFAEEKQETQTVNKEWCEITSPVSVELNKPFTITVKVIKTEPGMILKGDLHFFSSSNGYKGFAAWGGKGKEVKDGETVTFTYTVKEDKGNPKVAPIFYLSKDGAYKDNNTKAVGKLVTIQK